MTHVLYNIDVPPQEAWASRPFEHDLSDLAPEAASQLDPIDGVRCEIAWHLVVDNAGRTWELRPGNGRRAKRIRWRDNDEVAAVVYALQSVSDPSYARWAA